MSRGTAAVRFPDGSVRFGIYNGTTDVLWWPLFDTSAEAWDAWTVYYRDGDWTEPDRPTGEDVQAVDIYSDYGGGFQWRGTASFSEAIGPRDPWDVPGDQIEIVRDGTPDWFSKALRGA